MYLLLLCAFVHGVCVCVNVCVTGHGATVHITSEGQRTTLWSCFFLSTSHPVISVTGPWKLHVSVRGQVASSSVWLLRIKLVSLSFPGFPLTPGPPHQSLEEGTRSHYRRL